MGGPLFPGSLNLWSTRKLKLPEPVTVINGAWALWPAVIGEAAAGVIALRSDIPDPRLVEVFSNIELAPLLRIEPGGRVLIRVFPGALLPLAV